LAVAGKGMLLALALPAPHGLAASVHAYSVAKPCRAIARAPIHRGGTPGKTLAHMRFTCARRHFRALATVQTQELIRGRWIHQATRTIKFFQVKAGRRYSVTTPPIDCSPGDYRTVASVKTGDGRTRARSRTVGITCGSRG
jgi:hypothetical protein